MRQLLWPFQTFTKSRGHHLLGDYNQLNEFESEEKVLPSFAQLASSTDGAIVLGQGNFHTFYNNFIVILFLH